MSPLPSMPETAHRIQLLYFRDCPHWRLAEERLSEIATRCGWPIEHQIVSTAEEAERVGFRGSPSILIDGIDVFATGDEPVGLSCRIYRTPARLEGSPTAEQIADAPDHAR